MAASGPGMGGMKGMPPMAINHPMAHQMMQNPAMMQQAQQMCHPQVMQQAQPDHYETSPWDPQSESAWSWGWSGGEQGVADMAPAHSAFSNWGDDYWGSCGCGSVGVADTGYPMAASGFVIAAASANATDGLQAPPLVLPPVVPAPVGQQELSVTRPPAAAHCSPPGTWNPEKAKLASTLEGLGIDEELFAKLRAEADAADVASGSDAFTLRRFAGIGPQARLLRAAPMKSEEFLAFLRPKQKELSAEQVARRLQDLAVQVMTDPIGKASDLHPFVLTLCNALALLLVDGNTAIDCKGRTQKPAGQQGESPVRQNSVDAEVILQASLDGLEAIRPGTAILDLATVSLLEDCVIKNLNLASDDSPRPAGFRSLAHFLSSEQARFASRGWRATASETWTGRWLRLLAAARDRAMEGLTREQSGQDARARVAAAWVRAQCDASGSEDLTAALGLPPLVLPPSSSAPASALLSGQRSLLVFESSAVAEKMCMEVPSIDKASPFLERPEEEALRALLRAPFLTDLAEAAAWGQIFQTRLGTLQAFAEKIAATQSGGKLLYHDELRLLCIARPSVAGGSPCFVRVPASADQQQLRAAVAVGDMRRAAAFLTVIFVDEKPSSNALGKLASCYAEGITNLHCELKMQAALDGSASDSSVPSLTEIAAAAAVLLLDMLPQRLAAAFAETVIFAPDVARNELASAMVQVCERLHVAQRYRMASRMASLGITWRLTPWVEAWRCFEDDMPKRGWEELMAVAGFQGASAGQRELPRPSLAGQKELTKSVGEGGESKDPTTTSGGWWSEPTWTPRATEAVEVACEVLSCRKNKHGGRIDQKKALYFTRDCFKQAWLTSSWAINSAPLATWQRDKLDKLPRELLPATRAALQVI